MDFDIVTIPLIASQPSQWVSNFTIEDEKVLLNGWLSDVLVNADQQLIQQVHPHVHGLQDVPLGHTLAFDVTHGEYLCRCCTWLQYQPLGVKPLRLMCWTACAMHSLVLAEADSCFTVYPAQCYHSQVR